MAQPLPPIDPAEAQRWKPFVRGPREQWLACEGAWPARFAAALHYAWPFARGQWRMGQLLGSLRCPALREVPFRSTCGVRVVIDVPSEDFRYLSGRLASEPLEVAVMSRLVRPGDVFADVGAHRGLYALNLLGRLGEHGLYFAFEPSPTRFRFLVQAFRDEGNRLRPINVGLSDVEGDATLIDEGATTAHLGSMDGDEPAIRVTRLDAELAGLPLEGRVLIVKTDTEGHDARVILGCTGLASRGVRPIFLTEFLPEIHGQTRADVIDAIEGVFGGGYRYFAVDSRAGALSEFVPLDPLPAHISNALAIPHEELHRLNACFRAATN